MSHSGQRPPVRGAGGECSSGETHNAERTRAAAEPRSPAARRQALARARCSALGTLWCVWGLLLVTTRAVAASAAADAAPQATDWACAPGVSITGSNSGFWAGYTAEARFALDGDVQTFWSSTGGDICCSESAPAWLLLSLGAVRPLATVRLLVFMLQDMSYTLAVANSTAGPFVTVARKDCDVCVMNQNLLSGQRWMTHALQPGVASSHIRLQVTWSAHGGIGGCFDMCDWATNVYEVRAFSPGVYPVETDAAEAQTLPPPAEAPQAVCPREVVPLVALADSGAGALLSGDAAMQPRGGGLRGGGWVSLTGVEARRSGAVEFSKVIHPRLECGCVRSNFMLLTVYVRIGGGTSMPGEGLVISLVDASRQTPGATSFMAGCGTRPALPANALSVVLDTSIGDATCDEPGTGARVVSTLAGPDREPLVLLSNTLGFSISRFRNERWIPIQFMIQNSAFIYSELKVAADGSWSWQQERTTNGVDMFVPGSVWADGGVVLQTGMMNSQYAEALRDVNTSLDAFYVVVSARTGELSSDAHAISGLRLECRPAAYPGSYVENWEGLRQPLIHLAMPPPYSSPPPPSSPRAYGMQGQSSAALGGISFAVAFGIAMTAIAGAFLALRRPKGVRRVITAGGEAAREETGPLLDDGVRIEPLPVPGPLPDEADEADAADCDVFLCYRRADYWLADTIYNKLQLGGLRVFKDVRGRMTGQPFGPALVVALRSAPVFAPMITLSSLQRMATAAEAGAPADMTLCEAITALYFRSTGDVRLIHPLLAGETPKLGLPGCVPGEERWVPLTKQPAYAQALAALPNAVPSATYAAVSAALLSAFGIALPAEYAALTVREIMLGRSPERGDAPPFVEGVICGSDLFVLDCLAQDLGLYIDSRYTPPAAQAAAEARKEKQRAAAALVADGTAP